MPRKRKPNDEATLATLKATIDDILTSRNRLNRVSADFLKVDVETALTFCKIARETPDPLKRKRNRENARKGYDTIVRLIDKVSLTRQDARFLAEKLEMLRSGLVHLGEEL